MQPQRTLGHLDNQFGHRCHHRHRFRKVEELRGQFHLGRQAQRTWVAWIICQSIFIIVDSFNVEDDFSLTIQPDRLCRRHHLRK